jgi:NADH:ubiquinone oxidoreductase subunit 5 (subunit L)/multisubunit Na+/H+ antiporter MnhA subunit
MPGVAAGFLVGAAAIAGLPPLNGFVSEWFLYLAAFGALEARGEAALALVLVGPLLALVGALALACFAKACGAVFLGLPRSAAARDAENPGSVLTAPIAALATACALIGLLPAMAGRLLDAAIGAELPAGAPRVGEAGHLGALGVGVLAFAALLALCGVALFRRTRGARRAATWDCGYAEPQPRMQYSASSFAAPLTSYFAALLGLRRAPPRAGGAAPVPAEFHTAAPDLLLERSVLPALRRLAHWTLYARYLQQGRLQVYLLYVGATLIVLLMLT